MFHLLYKIYNISDDNKSESLAKKIANKYPLY